MWCIYNRTNVRVQSSHTTPRLLLCFLPLSWPWASHPTALHAAWPMATCTKGGGCLVNLAAVNLVVGNVVESRNNEVWGMQSTRGWEGTAGSPGI